MISPRRILVVEDDPPLAAEIRRGLLDAGFEVELVAHGDAAFDAAQRFEPDLVVLDLMLPGTPGEALLEAWRHRLSRPVIVLTARVELSDRLRAFELGAADFLPKPFWMAELLARIRTRLHAPGEAEVPPVDVEDVRVDRAGRRVTRAGAPVSLTPHEMNILLYLLDRPGRALSRAQIAEGTLSPGDEAPEARTVDSHVARIRKKLGAAAGAHIQTVWRIGYRFDP